MVGYGNFFEMLANYGTILSPKNENASFKELGIQS
jgi:hypothetical protein